MIKQGIPALRPAALESQFPVVVGSTAKALISHVEDTDDEVDRLEKTLARARRRQIVDTEAAKFVIDLRPAALGKEKEGKVETTQAKRYDVDPETGVISVNEEDGEHSYKDALLVSSSIKTKRGEYDQVINIMKAIKELQTDGGKDEKAKKGFYVKDDGTIVSDPENGDLTLSEARTISESKRALTTTKDEKAKKGFYVKDDGTIVSDPENGDLTLSEARAISESKRALVTPTSKEQFTPEKFELMRRDLLGDLTASVEQSIAQIRSQLTPKEQEALFTLGEDGKTPVVNPKARMSLTEFIMLQMAQNMGKKADGPLALYKDTEGNALPLPDWLTMRKFLGEEKRKDDMHEAVQGLIKEGKEQLPKLVEGLRNLAGSKETSESMTAGGWNAPRAKTQGVNSAPCPGCHEPITYTETPAIIQCPKCKALAIFGSAEERKVLLDQLTPPAPKEEKKEIPEGAPPEKEIEGEKK